MENLQLVLAGGKGPTTDLSVFLSDKEHALFVYPGLALLERVDSDPNQFAYKMLVGRFVNAKTPLEELKRCLGHCQRGTKRTHQAERKLLLRLVVGTG